MRKKFIVKLGVLMMSSVMLAGCGEKQVDNTQLNLVGMSVEEYSNQLIYFNDGSAFPTCELLEKMSDLYNNDLLPQQDILSLKKRIKYCKNPMEKKKLQQELNALYKEQKRRK